jgi:hypothetical protein
MDSEGSKGSNFNLLVSLSRFGVGGIQTFVLELVNQLSRNYPEINVYVYCYYPELTSIDRGST